MLQSSSFWSNANAAHRRNIPQHALRAGEMIGERNSKKIKLPAAILGAHMRINANLR
jgi:hypothetical protein